MFLVPRLFYLTRELYQVVPDGYRQYRLGKMPEYSELGREILGSYCDSDPGKLSLDWGAG